MNLLRLFRQSLFSSGAACKRTLARNTRRLLPLAAVLAVRRDGTGAGAPHDA